MLKKLSGFNLGEFFAFKVAPELPQKFVPNSSIDFPEKNEITFFQMPAPYNIGDGRKSDSTHPDSFLNVADRSRTINPVKASLLYIWHLWH